MVQIIDIILPVLSLVIASLLTLPVFRVIRKSTHKTALTLAWVVVAIGIASLAVINLAIGYYSTVNPASLNLAIDGTTSTAITSSFLIDAISIFMAIIIVATAAVVLIPTEKLPGER